MLVIYLINFNLKKKDLKISLFTIKYYLKMNLNIYFNYR